MRKAEIISCFDFQERSFHFSVGRLPDDDSEYILLSESMRVIGKPLQHVMKSDGILDKTEPIIFAFMSPKETGIQVSMHYEGLPLSLMRRFVDFVEKRWGSLDGIGQSTLT